LNDFFEFGFRISDLLFESELISEMLIYKSSTIKQRPGLPLLQRRERG